MSRMNEPAIARWAMTSLLWALSAACSIEPMDPSLPVYRTEQVDSIHPGYRQSTISTAGAEYVNDREEQSLQLIDTDPKKVIGRTEFGNGRICAIAGQEPSAYVAVDVGSEMPAYEVFRSTRHPMFDWRHATFQKLRLTVPMGPSANKETTEAALIDDLVRTLRDGAPASPPVGPLPMTFAASSTGVYGVLLYSDQLPGLAFRPSCYLAPSGEVYLADSLVVTFSRTAQTVEAAWIPASPLFTRWATTP